MKKYLFRTENFMLLFFALLLGICKAIAWPDIFSNDHFHVLPIFYRVYCMCMILAGVAWVCHYMLCRTGLRQKWVVLVHVWASILLAFLVMIDVLWNVPVFIKGIQPVWPTPWYVEHCSLWHNIRQQAFAGLQMLFVAYTLIRILSRRKNS